MASKKQDAAALKRAVADANTKNVAAETSANEVIAAASAGASTKVASKSRSGEKVAVGCKLPHGLQLRVFTMVESTELVMGGGTKTIKIAQQMGDVVRLRGTLIPPGKFPLFPIVNGAAITHNVDAEFFALWLEQNKTSDVVKNGFVFAHKDADYVADQAADFEKVRTGLEPLDPNNLPRGIATMDAK